MTETAAPTPAWLVVLQGFLPSLNQALVVVVTAGVTLASTVGLQWAAAPRGAIPAADKPAPLPLQKQIDDAVNRLDGRLTEAIGKADLCVDMLTPHAKDWKTPRAAPRPAAVK